MEDLQSSEESAFVQEDVSAIIKEVRRASSLRLTRMRARKRVGPHAAASRSQAIETVLLPCTYQHTKVPQWTNNVRAPCAAHRPLANARFGAGIVCPELQRRPSTAQPHPSCGRSSRAA